MSSADQGWKSIKDAPRDGTVIEIKDQEPPGTYRYSNGYWVAALKASFQTNVLMQPRSGRPLKDEDHLTWR